MTPQQRGRPGVRGRFGTGISEEIASAIAEVRAIYADLAARPVDRNCTLSTGCCQFRLTGRTPYLTKGEAIVAAKGVRAAGRKELPDLRRPPFWLPNPLLRRRRRTVCPK